jgi:hypothetical protein
MDGVEGANMFLSMFQILYYYYYYLSILYF